MLPLFGILAWAVAATGAPAAEIQSATESLTASLVATRRDIHSHPELGNRETRTGKLVADRLTALGLEVRYPVAKTGVVGILRGGPPRPPRGGPARPAPLPS